MASAVDQLLICVNNPLRIRLSPPMLVLVLRIQVREKSGSTRDIPLRGRSAHLRLSSLYMT
ncbi:MAG: hypothetical protein EU549_02410 [Promethearchaeota archaeon]|nr:MAG: hypothetical protein EU549_02410 [Candidatus Lokiarchaeota archaeon]